jgi:signal transduction protein with GAF and PtsI domain
LGENVPVSSDADQLSRLRVLVDAGIALSSELSLDALLQRIVETAAEITGARYAALGVIDRTGQALERFLTTGIDPETQAAIGDLPHGRGILGVLIRDAQPLRLADLSDDPRSVGFPPNHPAMRSFLGVPVMAGGAVFGNLYLTERAEGEFTEEDEQIATLLAAQAGVAIQNARLYARMNEHAEALRRALGDLSSVSVINESILSGQPRERVLTVIAERAAESLGVRLVAVAIPDADGAGSTYVAAAGTGHHDFVGVPVAPDSTTETVLLARR